MIVLPLTREWIEIRSYRHSRHRRDVLPLTREWIEIFFNTYMHEKKLFSLSRGSGLK